MPQYRHVDWKSHWRGVVHDVGRWVLIIYGLLFTTKVPKKVPSTFACAPSSIEEKVAHATAIVSGHVDAVLPGTPYADVWVQPTHWYKGNPALTVRFSAWPRTKSTAGIGDLHFAAGSAEYVFFFRPLSSGALTTSACYGTRLLTTSGLTAAEQAALQ